MFFIGIDQVRDRRQYLLTFLRRGFFPAFKCFLRRHNRFLYIGFGGFRDFRQFFAVNWAVYGNQFFITGRNPFTANIKIVFLLQLCFHQYHPFYVLVFISNFIYMI